MSPGNIVWCAFPRSPAPAAARGGSSCGRTCPGIPVVCGARVAAATGSTVFAMRTKLVELVLQEDEYRTRMMNEIEPRYWVAPALAALDDHWEPLQGGRDQAARDHQAVGTSALVRSPRAARRERRGGLQLSQSRGRAAARDHQRARADGQRRSRLRDEQGRRRHPPADRARGRVVSARCVSARRRARARSHRRARSSRSSRAPSATAAPPPSTRSTSPSSAARSTASSARTAPASRP